MVTLVKLSTAAAVVMPAAAAVWTSDGWRLRRYQVRDQLLRHRRNGNVTNLPVKLPVALIWIKRGEVSEQGRWCVGVLCKMEKADEKSKNGCHCSFRLRVCCNLLLRLVQARRHLDVS